MYIVYSILNYEITSMLRIKKYLIKAFPNKSFEFITKASRVGLYLCAVLR